MLKEVEDYLESVGKWQKELRQLRRIILSAGLTETYKWRQPCYTYNKKNVVMIGEFKDYCLISFFKGVLLKDEVNILVALTKNIQAERIIKIRNLEQIKELEDIIYNYIIEAIEIENSGVKVEMKDTTDYEVPDELVNMFREIPEFKEAFKQLTPGRQRGYLLHYAGAKQSKTRASRIEKSMDRVFAGKGLQDCICGHSKKMPRCDGSHKNYELKDYI